MLVGTSGGAQLFKSRRGQWEHWLSPGRQENVLSWGSEGQLPTSAAASVAHAPVPQPGPGMLKVAVLPTWGGGGGGGRGAQGPSLRLSRSPSCSPTAHPNRSRFQPFCPPPPTTSLAAAEFPALAPPAPAPPPPPPLRDTDVAEPLRRKAQAASNSQTTKLFSDIAIGAFRCDTGGP